MSRRWVYVLRSDRPDGVSHGGFRWPESGPVEAPDWDPTPRCGGGLHGLAWGCGSAGLLHQPDDPETVWRVVKVAAGDVVDLGGKVKVRGGEVVYCGGRDGALALLDRRGAAGMPVVYASRTGGDGSTVTGGYGSTVTGGYRSTVTGGDGSIIQAAYWDGRRRRIVTGYIGEDGLLPGVPYRLDVERRFVRADGGAAT